MKVLVCPQEFKGSLTARAAAEAIAAGVARADPSAAVDLLPMSDGGPGFLEAMQAALPSEMVSVPCRDPLGRMVEGHILVAGDVIFIEAAQANGLSLLSGDELAPLAATTAGVADLLEAAAAFEPRQIVIGVGGSATNDGGIGMAIALGARLLDRDENELPPGLEFLPLLARIAWRRPASLARIELVVATDVRNPLTGPSGAAAVFGPQKGASPEDVRTIETALSILGLAVEGLFGTRIADLPGAGAAGGLAGGLVAFLGARIASGLDVVATATGLSERIAGTDLVITGEGRYDEQSAMGKVTGRVCAMAAEAGVRCLVLAGSADEGVAGEVRTLESLTTSSEDAMRRAAELLTELAADALSSR